MSQHDGVSCDSCLKGNFRGRRYKCLVCYDYDLCASCYEGGASTTRHLTDHPMQCILTRTDFELYYGGEGISVEQPQSLTCPYCTKMGFTEATLQEHVTADHPDTSFEVVCPVCASLPGGDPNHVTEDFAGHLTLEHRSGPRDLMSFLDESASTRPNVRRIPHPSRGVGGPRARRTNMHFSSSGGISPSNSTIDPIAELLSQLSGVRRTGSSQSSSAPSQLQQLQMQLQLERQQVRAARQQLERLPRRQTQVIGSVNSGGGSSTGHSTTMATVLANNTISTNNVPSNSNTVSFSTASSTLQNSTFLIPRCITTTLSDSQLHTIERESANRSLFARELVVSTLAQALSDLIENQVPFEKEKSPNFNSNLLTNNHETSAMNLDTKSRETLNSSEEVKTDEPTAVNNEKLVHSSSLQHETDNTASEIPSALNDVVIQNASIVQALRHNVPPQPMVLQQSPPVRNTGTGTIREQISAPAAAYIRSGVSSVGVTGGSRRKPVRPIDGRNQSTDPPPPH